jgi:DNA mismatch repair protein MutS
MMEQYYQLKKQVPDLLLLFRMGDFYEVFFEDAQKTARLLNITLTHRGKLGEFPIPMAGIPHHAANAYIDRLTALGEKVAICEQIQDPKEAKGIVERGITQIASPAMPYDLEKADSKKAHFMMAGSFEPAYGLFALAVIDYTTGAFFGSIHESAESFLEEIRSLGPTEWITSMGQWEGLEGLKNVLEESHAVVTHLSEEFFSPKFTDLYLSKLLPSYKTDKTLQAHEQIFSPLGALAYYVCSTQDRESYRHIQPFQLKSDEACMRASTATLIGLEILPRHRDVYKSSLLGFFDKTQTALGSRMLKTLFQKPLLDIKKITERQEFIADCLKKPELMENVRAELSQVRDLERILAKMATGKASATDLLQLAQASVIHDRLLGLMKSFKLAWLPRLEPKTLGQLQALAQKIQKTLNSEIGASLDKGNLICEGVHKERDKLARLAYNVADELLKLEARYRDETQITKLRIKNNNVQGYFIEVSKGQTDKAPEWFHRRQTLTNCERYVTEELAQFEKEIVLAKDKLEKLEREIFKDLLEQGLDLAHGIRTLAHALSLIDAFTSLAYVAYQEDFSRPKISKKENELILKGAWHPLIKASLKDQFVPHDLTLNSETFFGLITGPNMAGKTTVMREVAIIQLLTQIGSYVPAKSVELSLCDYLFSRLGASDDILRGQSTFMVEMSETAEILRHATSQSLIILDEVGRGTSTYDGLSIAWALTEHLIDKTRARTLFATHYHELIEVISNRAQAKNLTVETYQQDGMVHFQYRLVERPASQSFGIYVAKLAGLPQTVLKRAQELLTELESPQEKASSSEYSDQVFKINGNQLTFLPEEPKAPQLPEEIRQMLSTLDGIDVMSTTPIEALMKLQELKDTLRH